jgi:hypothetical protein
MSARVNRLGGFSKIGHLFSLGRFYKITEVAKNLGLRCFRSKILELLLTKNGFGLNFFPQTHLVTLLPVDGLKLGCQIFHATT